MFQKCPVCDGSGKMFVPPIPGTSASGYETACGTCGGEKIIHVNSGYPPSLHNMTNVKTSPKRRRRR